MQRSEISYQSTIYACYVGFIVQATVVNLTPILFIPLRELYGLSYEQLGALILVNFITQVTTDIAFSTLADRYGFRRFVAAAQVLCVLGFALFAASPLLFDVPYTGFLLGTVVFSIGGGLMELLLSPIVNAIPTPEKAAAMSVLHSFYAWGQVAVVLLTTLFIFLAGREAWPFIVLLWAILPFVNFFFFLRVPMAPPIPEEHRQGMRHLINQPFFLVACLAIMLGAAAELNMGQWTSAFMEKALHLPKLLGDVAGVSMFAFMLGLARLLYGKYGSRVNVSKVMMVGSLVAAACYLVVAISPIPFLSLLACALTGFAVSLLWPGTLVAASEFYPRAGAWMFAILAASGDIGAALGPWAMSLVTEEGPRLAAVANLAGSLGLSSEQAGLRLGMLWAMFIPLGCFFCHRWLLQRRQAVLPEQPPAEATATV